MGLRELWRQTRKLKQRAYVFTDLGFRPTMNEHCPFDKTGRWRPGCVYARGNERICIFCLSGWSVQRQQWLEGDPEAVIANYSGLNIFDYQPRTMEEIGAKLYPQGFSLKPPGTIVPL